MNRYDKQMLGETGVIYINSLGEVIADVWKITTLTDVIFDFLDNEVGSGDDLGASATLIPAGVNIYGKFTRIILATGAVAAYKSDKL
jgi:hypothetical protein